MNPILEKNIWLAGRLRFNCLLGQDSQFFFLFFFLVGSFSLHISCIIIDNLYSNLHNLHILDSMEKNADIIDSVGSSGNLER